MFNKDLLNKVLNEDQPLTSEEERLIDRALEVQQPLQFVVGAMPEEALSLSWRSQVNERILAVAQKARKRSRLIMVWRPVLGLGLAGALALVFTMKDPSSVEPAVGARPAIEAALLQAHQDSVQATEIAGPGLAQHEARTASAPSQDDLYDWSEVDVETL